MLPRSLTSDSQWRFEFQQRSRGLNQTFTQDWKIWAVSQVPPQDDESPPDGCSLFLSLQSTTEPLRGDDTKIKVVMEMKEGREGGDEGCSGGEVGEWMEKSKPARH